jgi:hypothetical protein
MTLTSHMRTLLRAIRAEAQRLAAPGRPSDGAGRRDQDRGDGVRHDLAAWLGHEPSAAQSAVFSRALRRLEQLGLVFRVSRWGSTRTTHVQLTPAGRAAAERIGDEDRAQLERVLSSGDWLPLEVAGQTEAHGADGGAQGGCAADRPRPRAPRRRKPAPRRMARKTRRSQ